MFPTKVSKEIKPCWEPHNAGVSGSGFRKRVKAEEGMPVGNPSHQGSTLLDWWGRGQGACLVIPNLDLSQMSFLSQADPPVAAAVVSHFNDCPDSHSQFCFHGTCRFLVQEDKPACV